MNSNKKIYYGRGLKVSISEKDIIDPEATKINKSNEQVLKKQIKKIIKKNIQDNIDNKDIPKIKRKVIRTNILL